MENKKHMVKQTKKRENNTTKKEKGKDQFSELDRLINTLNNKPVMFHLNQNTEYEEFVIFENRMQKINYYSTNPFWRIDNDPAPNMDDETYKEEQEKYIKRQIKIKNPTKFDLDKVFEDLKQFFVQDGRFIEFIKKIDAMADKVDAINGWENITGDKVKYPFPLEVYKTYLKIKDENGRLVVDSKYLEEYYTSSKSTIEMFKIPGGPNYTEIQKITIPPGKPLPLKTHPDDPEIIESDKYLIIREFLEQYFKGLWDRPGTFAIPSDHKQWDPLLLLFAGDPGIVRKKAFRKAPEERTPEEQKEVDAYTENLFNTDAVGRIASVNILNAGNGNLDIFLKPQDQKELFKRDLDYQKERAVMEFYKTIGSPEGLRHYLAIFQGLDRAGRTGRFTFNMNKHLDRLGYKKHKGETHQRKNKENALKIIQFLDNAVMDIQDPKDPTKNCRFRLLSSNIRYDNRDGINPLDRVESIKITMDDWYLEAFKNIPGTGPRYTKLLDQLITEDHQRRWITLLLVPRLAILWRINGIKGPPNGLTVSLLLNVTAQGNGRKDRAIKRLESELNYMKQKEYIGSWHHDGDGKTIHESSHPENVHVFISGPDWSRKEMESIKENRDHHLATETDPDPMTFEQFDEIFQTFQDAGYSQENIARHTGLSRTALYNWRKRKRKISNENAQRIREFYLSIIEKTKPETDPE